MVEAVIHGIFPTPIYISKINRELSKKEIVLIKKSKVNSYKNEGNITSKDSYILNSPSFNVLKKELQKIVEDYFDKIIQPEKGITPYITQSWLNYTEENQYHHKHKHPNSLVSGVFYIDCHKELDKINFYRESYPAIAPRIKTYNPFNSESWYFPVKTGDVLLFPSSLTHMVVTKEGSNTRTSLAFNVFVKGNIGSKESLTELII